MAPKSVTFRRHDHLVSVLFGDLLSHSYNITFSMFLDLVTIITMQFELHSESIILLPKDSKSKGLRQTARVLQH